MLNYFNCSLSKLPKMFGLTQLHKGFFPHLFSTAANQEYEGPMPEMKYYDPDGMKPEQREAFLKWYSTQTEFHFHADLIKYCKSDVDILQRCCGQFRSNFLAMTDGVEPFVNAVTIASACNRVYRTRFLEPEQIAVIPPNGYSNDNQSVIALCWLDWLARTQNLTIQHAFQGGEAVVDGKKVDGLDQHGTVYEVGTINDDNDDFELTMICMMLMTCFL